MPTSPYPQRPLTDLLEELEAAVHAGDRARAIQLEQAILQRIAAEAADRTGLERRVRALMATLDQQRPGDRITKTIAKVKSDASTLDRQPTDSRAKNLDPLNLERSSPPADADGIVYPVWFGTNRKPTARADGFTGERYHRITRGRAEVYVPQAHRFGETGTNFWQRLLRFDLRDDRLRLQHVEKQGREAFFADMGQAMQSARESGEPPHALFYLHGFNVTFEEAAVRAAQIGYDLKVPGATAFFSWPSRGSVTAYPVDEASIEASEPAITEFLVDFAANCGAEKVHVIAHSMGNRGLLRALQRIAANAETQGTVTFGQVFLAAPDVDRDLFLDLARLYPQHAERTTLYASDGDLAVHLSAKLHDAPRAGYYTPYTVVADVDTVAVPDFDIDLLGHAYFAQAQALLHDIHDLMRHNEAPARRQRITPSVHGGATFWKLAR